MMLHYYSELENPPSPNCTHLGLAHMELRFNPTPAELFSCYKKKKPTHEMRKCLSYYYTQKMLARRSSLKMEDFKSSSLMLKPCATRTLADVMIKPKKSPYITKQCVTFTL